MTPTRLEAVGRVLYGPRWQTDLAADLGVTYRTMRRWVSGESPIPGGVEADLRRLLAERRIEIDGLLAA